MRERERQRATEERLKLEAEEAKASYAKAKREADDIIREQMQRRAVEELSKTIEEATINPEKKSKSLSKPNAELETKTTADTQTEFAPAKEPLSTPQHPQPEPILIKDTKKETPEERKEKIRRAITDRYAETALFDNALGFSHPIRAVKSDFLWSSLTSTVPVPQLTLSGESYQVVSFNRMHQDVFAHLAKFLVAHKNDICGVCMTAQKSSEASVKPSLVAPLLKQEDSNVRIFVAVAGADISLGGIPREVATLVEEITGGIGVCDEKNPLHLFSRQSHFSSLANRPILKQKTAKCTKTTADNDTPFCETSVVQIKNHAFECEKTLAAIFEAAEGGGLSIVGLKALWLTQEELNGFSKSMSSLRTLEVDDSSFTFVMAVRGVSVGVRWSQITGPNDPMLARRTDPESLRARYGKGCKMNLTRDIPNLLSNASRELGFFFGGRVLWKDEGEEEENPHRNKRDLQKAVSHGVGGAWPGKNKSKNTRTQQPATKATTTATATATTTTKTKKSTTPIILPAFFVCPRKVEDVYFSVLDHRNIGKVLETVINLGGMRVCGCRRITRESHAMVFKARGEGAPFNLTRLGLEDCIDVVDACPMDEEGVPKEEVAIALGNGPPKDVNKLFAEDVDDVIVLVVTPDSFRRDFSGADICFGTVVKQLLTPFVEINGQFVNGNANGTNKQRCAFGSSLLGMKIFPVVTDDKFANAIASTAQLPAEAAKLSERIIGDGPVAVICLRGQRGFGAAMRRRVGPMDNLAGGSLSARAFNVDCIRAQFSGDGCEEPGVLIAGGRNTTYNLLCHCFEYSELFLGDKEKESGEEGVEEETMVTHPLLSLFPFTLPPSLVTFIVPNLKKLPSILKRAERSDFGVLALKLLESGESGSGGAAVMLRRCNGQSVWRKIVGPSDYDLAKRDAPNSLVAVYGADIVKVVDDVGLIFGKECEEKKIKQALMRWSCSLMDGSGNGEGKELTRPVRGGSGGVGAEKLMQEGSIDGFTSGKFIRKSISLNESACAVFLPKLVDEIGVSKIIEGLQKNFNIIALRLVRWTSTSAKMFLDARGRGGWGGKKNYIGDMKLMDKLEYDLDRVSLVVGVESDNCLIRLQKMIGDGCDVEGGEGGGSAKKTIEPRGFMSFNSSRSKSFNDNGLFVMEDGSQGAFGSRTVKNSQEELKCVFSYLDGEDSIVFLNKI